MSIQKLLGLTAALTASLYDYSNPYALKRKSNYDYELDRKASYKRSVIPKNGFRKTRRITTQTTVQTSHIIPRSVLLLG